MAAQGAGEASVGRTISPLATLTLLLKVDSDNHGWSIVRIVLPMLPAAVAHVRRLPEVSSTTAASMAAFVVMVMVALLLTLYTYIGHDHL